MDIKQVLSLSAMPLPSPSYPRGPYRFVDREYFIIVYRSDPKAIRAMVPEPLEPDGSNLVYFEFIRMPDSFGFGDYVESGSVIPCTHKGRAVNFTSQMYLDCHPPIVAGREIWGFPKKLAEPKLETVHDTLVGTLKYSGQEVAMGTMKYKHENLLCPGNKKENCNPEAIIAKMSKPQVNLKIIPCVTGKTALAQLVEYSLTDIEMKGAWGGDARLHLIPHVNAPVADLPVVEVLSGMHFIADLTLPYGTIIHDYLK